MENRAWSLASRSGMQHLMLKWLKEFNMVISVTSSLCNFIIFLPAPKFIRSKMFLMMSFAFVIIIISRHCPAEYYWTREFTCLMFATGRSRDTHCRQLAREEKKMAPILAIHGTIARYFINMEIM